MKQVYNPSTALIITSVDAFEVSPCTIFTDDNVVVNLYATDTVKNDAITKLSIVSFPTLPASGEVVEGKYYSYMGTVVKCVQTHQRTLFAPIETPALFAVYRDNSGTLAWITNERVEVGWKRTFKNKVYIVLQAHQTQDTWNPELTLGTLWQVVVTSSAWTTGVAYKVNDIVTYSGKTYKCLQGHTSISTWYPSIVPALWKLQ
jgi:hypothetical protein